MRITAELLGRAEQRTNPLGDRELVLLGLGIPALENMGAARDDFDCYNLNSNRIGRLENMSRLHRLSTLLCSGNLIESVDVNNLSKNVPNLKHLSLSHNCISSLLEVANIGKSFPKLEFLDLVGNPVTRRQHYRLYAIHHIPSLRQLDYQKIKPAERVKAERLAHSAAGAALESDLQQQRHQQQTAPTFTPGEGPDGVAILAADFTNEQKEQIRDLLLRAASLQEVEEIESHVRKGILPPQLRLRENEEPSAKRLKAA